VQKIPMIEPTVFAESTQTHFNTILKVGRHKLTADEPPASGGQDAGPGPHELLLCSLGACTAITVRMYADRKGFDLKNISVALGLEKTGESTRIFRRVTLEGNLTGDERDRLMHVANACPVHKTLTNPIHIETTLEDKSEIRSIE